MKFSIFTAEKKNPCILHGQVFVMKLRKAYLFISKPWVSQEKWFIFILLVPSKNDNRCPRKSGLSPSYYCSLCLPLCRARLPFVLVETYSDGSLVGKELVILLFVCVVGKIVSCVLCIFFPTLCLCWDFKFNCIDSWSLYSYFEQG